MNAAEKLEVTYANYNVGTLRSAGLSPTTEQFESWRSEARNLLAEVRRQAAKEAWDAGLKAGLRECNDHNRGRVSNPALNPHRNEQ